jgi:hypothetical protein
MAGSDSAFTPRHFKLAIIQRRRIRSASATIFFQLEEGCIKQHDRAIIAAIEALHWSSHFHVFEEPVLELKLFFKSDKNSSHD